jgi:hypothetical protein
MHKNNPAFRDNCALRIPKHCVLNVVVYRSELVVRHLRVSRHFEELTCKFATLWLAAKTPTWVLAGFSSLNGCDEPDLVARYSRISSYRAMNTIKMLVIPSQPHKNDVDRPVFSHKTWLAASALSHNLFEGCHSDMESYDGLTVHLLLLPVLVYVSRIYGRNPESLTLYGGIRLVLQ